MSIRINHTAGGSLRRSQRNTLATRSVHTHTFFFFNSETSPNMLEPQALKLWEKPGSGHEWTFLLPSVERALTNQDQEDTLPGGGTSGSFC